MNMVDNVNHPPHYTSHPSGVECITITEHMNFNVGNAVKYLWRAGLKEIITPDISAADAYIRSIDFVAANAKHLEDLNKAAWYIDREIKRLSQVTTGVDRASGEDKTVIWRARRREAGSVEFIDSMEKK